MEKVESLVWEIAQTNLTATNALPLDRAFLPWRSASINSRTPSIGKGHENSSSLCQSPNGKKELTRLFTACADLLPSASCKPSFSSSNFCSTTNFVQTLFPRSPSKQAIVYTTRTLLSALFHSPEPLSSKALVTRSQMDLRFLRLIRHSKSYVDPASQFLATPEPQQHSTPDTAPRPKCQRNLQHEPNTKPPWKTASLWCEKIRDLFQQRIESLRRDSNTCIHRARFNICKRNHITQIVVMSVSLRNGLPALKVAAYNSRPLTSRLN